MYGYQPPAARRLAQTPEQYADGGLVARMKSADAGPAAFGARGLSQLRDMVPKVAAMGFPQQAQAPAPAPVSDPRVAQLQAMIPQMEAMGFQKRPLTPQMLARGGLVRGPGTGTSDSIPDQAEPGTYIMPADSTAAIGPSALEKMGTVPVRLSDGEMKLPPEQVMAIGEAVLKLMKDATHTPVNGEDGGQTDAEVDEDDGTRGFNPADRMAQMPQMYADGGMVDPNRPNSFGDAAAVTRDPGVTEVGAGYQPGNGTVSVVPSQPVAPPAPTRPPNTVVSMINPEWDRVAKQPGAAPAPQNAAAALTSPPAPAAAPTAPTPAPQPAAAMGWLERNKQRNAEVSAASIANRPEWSKTQGAPAPALPPEPPPPAPPPVDSRISMPPSTFQSKAAYGFQPRRYADGGMVEDDLQKRLMQIPSSAPPGWSGNIPTSAPPGWNGGGGGSGGGGGAGGVTGSWEAPQAAPAPAQPAGALTRAASMSAPPTPAPAVQAMGTMPVNPNGGQISTRSMGAADGLARRGAADAMALMPNAPAPVQAPTVLTSENSWQKRNDLRNALVSASSITANGGRFDRNKGESPESLTYRAMLGTDQALQASAPGLAQAAMREQGDTQRAGLQVTANSVQGAADRQNALERTLIGERGANSRAGISALAATEAARLKAQQENKPPAGYRWAEGGKLEAIPGGPAGDGKPLTEDQAKSAGYALRMDNALKLIDEVGKKDPSAIRPGIVTSAINSLPETAANALRSTGRQRVEAAQLDALDAALTLNTGAAYTREQLQGLSKSYFAQPNDDDATVADKANRLQSLIDTARLRAGEKGAAMTDAAQTKNAARTGGAPVAEVPPQIAELQRRAASNPALAARLKEMGY